MAAIRILFVEDSADDVFLAEHSLRLAGLDVESTRVHSESMLRCALSEWRPDIIVSDCAMPGFDGLNAFVIARDIAPETPFLFRSGGIRGRRASEAISRGAVGFVEKENIPDFVRLVTSTLSRSRSPRA